MRTITPFLWFDNNAEEALNYYVSAFKDSGIVNVSRLSPEGSDKPGMMRNATFRLAGQEFFALNGGPGFSFTPAVSFFVSCETQQEIDALWLKLAKGGTVLMELNRYPFSPRFGWLVDQFGVSWQLHLTGLAQSIAPCLMFVGKQSGQAETAIKEYTALFDNSTVRAIERYGPGEGEPAGTVKHARFVLLRQEFVAMDSSLEHAFTFTPAISFFVDCETQQQVDLLWDRLAEGGKTEQCGWLKDKYGLSWQIVPSILGKLLGDKDPDKASRVMQAMLQMTKLDIRALEQAYNSG